MVVGEGLAQGATMGAYGALANLADEGYGERLSARADANQALATGSNVVGAVLPSLLSGGVGSAGALARLTPAGQLANLSTKLGVALSARAATGIGRIGALAATGAVEGALDRGHGAGQPALLAVAGDDHPQHHRGPPVEGAKVASPSVVKTAMHPMPPSRTAWLPRPNSRVVAAATPTAARVASASLGVQAIAASTKRPTERSREKMIWA